MVDWPLEDPEANVKKLMSCADKLLTRDLFGSQRDAHPYCAFLAFTNATLIDDDFCREVERVGNFVPAISVEGIGVATDERRGAGASPELMATAAQRERLMRFVREMRKEKELFTLDFQNDGEFVGGCIAGGRRYLHINAAGDVEPCVFAHYSNANIREASLLDALRSPLFMAYHDGQPFDGNNLLRPCPIYENTGKLAEMVEASGAKSTDLEHEEGSRELGEKLRTRAEEWAPVAKRLWYDEAGGRARWRRRRYVAQSEADIAKFERLGRMGDVTLAERDADIERIKARR